MHVADCQLPCDCIGCRTTVSSQHDDVNSLLVEAGNRFGGRRFYWISITDKTSGFPDCGNEHHSLTISFERFGSFFEQADFDLQLGTESAISEGNASPVYEPRHSLASVGLKVRNIVER